MAFWEALLSIELVEVFKVEGKFVIQMKKEEWRGEFVDVMCDELLPKYSNM